MSVGFHVYDGLLSRAIYNHDFSVRCDLARMFANANQNKFSLLSSNARRPRAPLFKSDSMDDYNRFRSMMQAIDLCVLDLAHH